MTFVIMQQRSHTICSPKLIPIFLHLEKFKGSIRSQGCEILSFHWTRETVQIEVIIVKPNFHVNISEQFMICEYMQPPFERSVDMDLKKMSTKMITLEKKSHVVRLILHIGTGQSNNSKIILKSIFL